MFSGQLGCSINKLVMHCIAKPYFACESVCSAASPDIQLEEDDDGLSISFRTLGSELSDALFGSEQLNMLTDDERHSKASI